MKNMTEGKPYKLIIGFSIPLLVGGVFQQVYNLVDTFIVGRFLGENALAGVGCTIYLTFFLYCLIMGMCNGAGILISQYYGKKDSESIGRTVTSMVWVAGGLTVIVMVVGTLFCNSFLELLSVPEDTIGYSEIYLKILYFFSLGNVLYNGTSAILRSFGDSKTPLYALIVASVSNVILDLLFILQLGMGVEGVAYATVIAQHISGIWCLVYLIRKREEFGLVDLKWNLDIEMSRSIVNIGVPMAFQNSLIAIGGMSVQRLINSYGMVVMAAYAAASKVDSIVIQVITSLGTALCVFTGQNIGGKRIDRIKVGMKSTLVLSIVSAVIIAIIAFAFGDKIMYIFLGEKANAMTVEQGANYLKIMGISYIICAIMQSYQNVIRGAGDVKTCMVAGMTELFGRVFFAYLLSGIIGVTGIWIATPLSWGCGCVVPLVRYYTGKWNK